MNPKDYVSYPIALALKKAGFDEPCDKWIASKSFSYYDEDECCDHNAVIRKGWIISQKQKERYDQEALPYLTLWQAQKWLREVKKWIVYIVPEYDKTRHQYLWNVKHLPFKIASGLTDSYTSYELALSAGIAAALELIKEQGE